MRKNKTGFTIQKYSMLPSKATACIVLLMISTFLSSCTSIEELPKYQFSEGVYRAKLQGMPAGKVYVDIREDTLHIFPVLSAKEELLLDTVNSKEIQIAAETDKAFSGVHTFSQPSFDLDVLTIPFKYRPSAGGIPRQLNTAFQGALYLGLRRDIFRISYRKTPLGSYKRSLNHFGYSAGFFSGIGSSTVNEFVTQNQVGYEYEGVVLLYGVAAIVGINKITVGLTAGVDQLLDRNRSSWIYQHKPWVGLAFGLNLN